MNRLIGRLRSGNNVAVIARVIGLRALALGANLGTGLLSAAVLGPGGRGEQAALIAAPLFLAAIATLGLHASLIYNMKAHPEQERRYLGTALLFALIAGIAITVAGWILLPYWLAQYGPDTIDAARLLLLLTPLGVISPLLTGALESHNRFGTANSMLYVQSLTTLIALALLWYLGRLTPLTAAMAYLFPSIPASLYFARVVFRMVPPLVTLERRVVHDLLHYGLRFYGVDLLGSISGYLDQIIIVALLPQAVVGVYVVALSLSRVLTMFQGAVTSVLFPKIAARSVASVIESVGLTVRVTLVVNGVGALGLAIVGPFALQLMYGERFMGAVVPFRILLLETVVSSAARILYQTFSAAGRPGWVSVIEAVGVSVSLVSMLLVVPHFGIEGAAACVLTASTVRLVCVLAALTTILRIRIPRLFLTPADVMGLVGR